MNTLLIIFSVIVLVSGVVLAVLSHPAFGLWRHRSTARLQQSPNWQGGRFQNQEYTPQFTGDSSAVWTLTRFVAGRDISRVPKSPVPAIKSDLKTLPDASDVLVWFGHSSYMFTLGGLRFLIDPVLKPEYPSSLMMKPFAGTDIYRPDDLPEVDVLIITHEHWDHMDYATLRDLRERVKHVYCPLGIADYLRYWDYPDDRITEMDWYDQSKRAELIVDCLPSRHFSNRLLGRGNQTLWASFMVEYAGRKVYIGGDGGYDQRFREIYDRFGPVDLAFLENGQYNDNWRYIHTTPTDLERVMLDLQPKQVFTVHHNKYALSVHPWREPQEVAQAIADKHHLRLLDQPIGTIVEF